MRGINRKFNYNQQSKSQITPIGPVKYAGNQEFLSHKTFHTQCTQAKKPRTMGTEKRTLVVVPYVSGLK